jgi:hypothetical protein
MKTANETNQDTWRGLEERGVDDLMAKAREAIVKASSRGKFRAEFVPSEWNLLFEQRMKELGYLVVQHSARYLMHWDKV